ncbi:type II toxin-antitoxin system VapC family toxin [Kamptonema cortianum]|uniref:Type II toxin-antitoxin system VapC family toxin n=1 Tax=Geitlerinema calcuttense NRMC-F 0142 TaxID=2922238 RepID=A0ABT7M0W2_9CYAN|nr:MULTISPECIES: type II toxin-antitoxin system VapC family toxin [Cyanophyceae]MDK3161807.1 type II toxin-antitoxin system VapC family toxin [Kamptonema cortianum]MDL5054378.1 type II toxin-antitoxin system VapC family toxin [Oscillatoria laete-virens NRMC-F 0139]MDL5057898.1 type II toxin-antitoxin system VapC family toxin [Geitlerinema calcuttense NRMC-F 0142]
MEHFCDTSFLCALYGKDAHSAAAERFVRSHRKALWISPMIDFEFTNGVKHRLFRKVLTRSQADTMLANLQTDLNAGRLIVPPCPMSDILAEAKKLALLHTETDGYRSFDILHVATASRMKASGFLTFDRNQRRLAGIAGLKPPDFNGSDF